MAERDYVRELLDEQKQLAARVSELHRDVITVHEAVESIPPLKQSIEELKGKQNTDEIDRASGRARVETARWILGGLFTVLITIGTWLGKSHFEHQDQITRNQQRIESIEAHSAGTAAALDAQRDAAADLAAELRAVRAVLDEMRGQQELMRADLRELRGRARQR